MKKWGFFIGVFFLCLSLNARPIVFTPLPFITSKKIFEETFGMANFIKGVLNKDIEFRYETQYDTIIELFKSNEIDIVILGPFPLVMLQKQFPAAKAIISFQESDGNQGYRCVLAKFSKDTLDFDKSKHLNVGLTQALSTCGYTKTKHLLKDNFHQNLDDMPFKYLNQHDEVALSLIRGTFQIGGLKESVAKQYESLGLEIIATSSYLPGFSLIVNTQTLSEKEIESITSSLLQAPKEIYQSWGKNFSFGMSTPNKDLMDSFLKSISNDTEVSK